MFLGLFATSCVHASGCVAIRIIAAYSPAARIQVNIDFTLCAAKFGPKNAEQTLLRRENIRQNGFYERISQVIPCKIRQKSVIFPHKKVQKEGGISAFPGCIFERFRVQNVCRNGMIFCKNADGSRHTPTEKSRVGVCWGGHWPPITHTHGLCKCAGGQWPPLRHGRKVARIFHAF